MDTGEDFRLIFQMEFEMMAVGVTMNNQEGNPMTETSQTRREMGHISDRRQFLKVAAFTAVTTAFAPARQVLAALHEHPADRRSLSLYNVHTHEEAYAIYWQEGRYNPKGLYHVDYILRDFRANQIMKIDPRLVDLLHTISTIVDPDLPVHIISGYRSPQTNARLRVTRRGIAKGSLHMSGQAADIRIPSVPTDHLRQVAMDLKRGGVGFYPDSDFVHVDIGPVRSW